MQGTVGRPAFKVTKALRRKVKQFAAKGMSQNEIAAVIGVGRMTLVKYFSEELGRGRRAQCRRDLLAIMRMGARFGRASAILWLEQRRQEPDERAE